MVSQCDSIERNLRNEAIYYTDCTEAKELFTKKMFDDRLVYIFPWGVAISIWSEIQSKLNLRGGSTAGGDHRVIITKHHKISLLSYVKFRCHTPNEFVVLPLGLDSSCLTVQTAAASQQCNDIAGSVLFLKNDRI